MQRVISSPLFVIGVLLTIVVAIAIFNTGPEPNYCQKSFVQREHAVVMFSTRMCPYCRQARAMFAANTIPFCEYNISASAENQRAFVALGGEGVPLIVIGDEAIHGFSEEAVTEELIRQGIL